MQKREPMQANSGKVTKEPEHLAQDQGMQVPHVKYVILKALGCLSIMF